MLISIEGKKQGSRIQGVEGPRVKELIGFIGLLGLRKKGSPAQTFGFYDKGARFLGFLIRCWMLDVGRSSSSLSLLGYLSLLGLPRTTNN